MASSTSSISSGELVLDTTATAVVEDSNDQQEIELQHAQLADDTVADAAGRKKAMASEASPLLAVSPPRIAIAGLARPLLRPTFLGFTLSSASGMYVPLATGVFLAVNITFLGFAYKPPESVLALPPPCSITLLAVGLIFSVCQVLASSLAKGTLESLEDARRQQQPLVLPASSRRQIVLCRVAVAIAALCLAVCMVCSIRGLFLAVSVRLGKFPCWAGATKGSFGAGLFVASALAAYCVVVGLGAAIYAD